MSLIDDLKVKIEAYAQQVATVGAEAAGKAREPEIKKAAQNEAKKTIVPYVIGAGVVALTGVLFGVTAVIAARRKRSGALAGEMRRIVRRRTASTTPP